MLFRSGPPTDSGCSYDPADIADRRGKYWLIFTQNAMSGEINIPNGHGEYLCDGSKIYGSLTPTADTRKIPASFGDVGT